MVFFWVLFPVVFPTISNNKLIPPICKLEINHLSNFWFLIAASYSFVPRGECVLYVLNVLCHVFVLYECHHVSVRVGISAALWGLSEKRLKARIKFIHYYYYSFQRNSNRFRQRQIVKSAKHKYKVDKTTCEWVNAYVLSKIPSYFPHSRNMKTPMN